jgi:hypothetical protein
VLIILNSVKTNDPSYAFLSAFGAQRYLDEMAAEKGTKKFDLMQYFDSSDLPVMKEKFLEMMDEYVVEYGKVGREVERFTEAIICPLYETLILYPSS